MNGYKEITPVEICKLNESVGNIKLIDVRTPEEFAEVHAVLAINLPLDQFSANEVEKLGFNQNESIYIICRSGARSATASQTLVNAGFKQVYNVTGGTIEWVELGYPTKNTKQKGA